MPTYSRKGAHVDGKREMTLDEFKEWIRGFDKDKDGRLSRDELREAIRATRAWFPGWKAKRGIKAADVNGDGFIDDTEIMVLMEFAQKNLGIRWFSRINRDELQEAIRSTRAWFPNWKAKRGVKAANVNGDGLIDDCEITALMEFAEKRVALHGFKEWVKQFDVDKDGRMNRDELREAIRSTGAWFPGWKANNGVKSADANGDGFIDDSEITALMEFAEKNLSIKIMP
ncbi:hypothetical protein RHSIM_Rhsim07G0228900 [Rhododendron simsii]|uniref:EF-hand domain-containing protein n=1 Tax=Rhododendron simsii TaxID=118357 RepID=A0A834GSL4_RHOSS|nr:hypothetical protein RHSIM_Rhsim07G0228900 [Rhododendron simsii]